MIGDEAWFVVDRYLDDAVVAGIKVVTIIHGKGTGALRNALWNKFKTDSRVKSYRPGQYGEGDYGVTVIEM
jgi:DNA mismatch repair protein MutS2